METIEIVKEILFITIPALLVLLTAYFLIKRTIENDREKRRHEVVLQNSRTITPVRLQAYERLTLFLERISMESLIMRSVKANMTAKQLQSSLLATIRAEYDHNLSQQIYVSTQTWEVLKSAKTNAIKIINSTAENIPPTSSGTDLSKNLLEAVMEMDKEPNSIAIDFLKNEISRMI